ncbi:MAG: ribbon-helix-helix domain-containing protein [Candidatus Woesearchaeota archaeon]
MKQQSKEISILNVRLPDEIISWIDELVKNEIFNSRSEAIREFSREYVLKMRGLK